MSGSQMQNQAFNSGTTKKTTDKVLPFNKIPPITGAQSFLVDSMCLVLCISLVSEVDGKTLLAIHELPANRAGPIKLTGITDESLPIKLSRLSLFQQHLNPAF